MLLLRILHIVLGAVWVGMFVFMTFFLGPALQESGPAGGPVMAAIQKRGIMVVLPVVALLTLISGFWMFMKVSGGDGAFMRSRAGMALGTGGVLALVAFIVGITITRPAMMRTGVLMKSLGPSTPDGERNATMAEVGRLRARVASVGRVIAVLLLATLLLMAVARYL